MPRQNRVLPTGEIVAAPFRGALMGNRGILHDESGRLGRARWRHKAWIACVLSFKGRQRQVMAPRRYTELFFFDEAVALAAGHRPCAECRRADFNRFRKAWADAAGTPGTLPSARSMDCALHAARIAGPDPGQARLEARLGMLPDGAFVLGAHDEARLLWAGCLHPYLADRYGPPEPALSGKKVIVLTPAPTLAALAAGYRPAVGL